METYDTSDMEHQFSSPVRRSNTGPFLDDPILNSPDSMHMRRGQSQILAQVSPPRQPPLRRAQTSGRLNVLHEAYAVVSNDASQMEVQDLVQATRLVHQIGSVLSDHMGRRLNSRSEGHQTGL
jgi:hypothetical protein